MTIGIIGSSEKRVTWNERNATVRIYGTSILVTGVTTLENALDVAKRNFKGFKALK